MEAEAVRKGAAHRSVPYHCSTLGSTLPDGALSSTITANPQLGATASHMEEELKKYHLTL